MAFGTRVDSLNDPQNPIIVHASKVFSQDMSPKQFAKLLLILGLPKVAKMLGFRFQGEVIDYFTKFSESIIAKCKEELKKNKKSKLL